MPVLSPEMKPPRLNSEGRPRPSATNPETNGWAKIQRGQSSVLPVDGSAAIGIVPQAFAQFDGERPALVCGEFGDAMAPVRDRRIPIGVVVVAGSRHRYCMAPGAAQNSAMEAEARLQRWPRSSRKNFDGSDI